MERIPSQNTATPAETALTSLQIVLPDALVHAVAEVVTRRLSDSLGQGTAEAATPWRTTREAIAYTRLPEGTFRKLAAAGRIPSHGGRCKLFHIRELDEALGYPGPTVGQKGVG